VDTEIQLADVFTGVAAHIAKNPGLVGQTKTSFQFHFHNPDQSFFINLKDGAGSAGPGTLEAADVTLEVDSEHGPTIFGGDMATVQKLYFGGTLKIAGNVMASNKLAALATMDKQLVEDARKARVAAGGGGAAAAPAASAAAAPAASQEATLGDLFTAIAAEIADKPEVVAKGKTVFQFEFDNPESSYFIDLKNAPGSAGPGKADAADVTIAVDTSARGHLFGGDMAAVQKLYFGGQIKISGNVMASNKLAALAGMDKSRVEKARKARLAAGAPAAAAPVAKKEPKKALAAEALAKLEPSWPASRALLAWCSCASRTPTACGPWTSVPTRPA
jgi:alkyl sulfatase BDS1-like metallo-beta-lactamase superfamily hydrolase